MRLTLSQIASAGAAAGSAFAGGLAGGLAEGFAGKFAGAGGCAGGFAGAGFGIENAAATGSAFLSCMPHSLVTQFTDELLVDMCAHMAVNHGVLALGGTASPQGGNIVIDNVDELAHWCKPFKRLRKACHAHARCQRDVLAGQSILNIGSWAKLDAGSAAASFENSAYHHCGVAYGSVAPHTDKGDATDVRVCFSFCATVNAGFSPPAWHAGATVEECIAGVAGHISNGSVTLQVGGVGAHHLAPKAPKTQSKLGRL